MWFFINVLSWTYCAIKYSWIDDGVLYFYPFEEDSFSYYDVTEFLVYTCVPIIFFIVYLAFKKPKNKVEE